MKREEAEESHPKRRKLRSTTEDPCQDEEYLKGTGPSERKMRNLQNCVIESACLIV